MAVQEKDIVLFDPLSCEKKVVKSSKAAEILGISKGTLLAYKSRRSYVKGFYVLPCDIENNELRKLIQVEDQHNEVWKKIDGSKTLVSSWGRYRNNRGIVLITENYKNQVQLSITENGKPRTVTPQTYVSKMFMQDRPIGQIIIHIDGNKYNNRVENLKYVHRSAVNRQIARKSIAIPVLQIHPETMEVIEEFSSMTEAAKSMYTSRDVICRAVNENRQALGFLWVKDIEFMK